MWSHRRHLVGPAVIAAAALGLLGSAEDGGCGSGVVTTAESLCSSTGGAWGDWGKAFESCTNPGHAVPAGTFTCKCAEAAPHWVDGIGCTSECSGAETMNGSSTEGKKCGPFPGGACAEDEVCNKLSCGAALGVGVEGTCVKRPLPDKCPTTKEQVCGCDGISYGNDCMRIRAGAALAHKGACDNPKCGMSGECPSGWICNINELSTGAPLEESYCVKRPASCPDVLVPVCGAAAPFCDWHNYDNDCLRLLAGKAFIHTGKCTAEDTASSEADFGPQVCD